MCRSHKRYKSPLGADDLRRASLLIQFDCTQRRITTFPKGKKQRNSCRLFGGRLASNYAGQMEWTGLETFHLTFQRGPLVRRGKTQWLDLSLSLSVQSDRFSLCRFCCPLRDGNICIESINIIKEHRATHLGHPKRQRSTRPLSLSVKTESGITSDVRNNSSRFQANSRRVFIIVIPQKGGGGTTTGDARKVNNNNQKQRQTEKLSDEQGA